MNAHVFREYDIRGTYPEDLSESFVPLLGRGLGTFLGRNGARKIALSRDCRTHSEQIAQWLTKGLVASGAQVLDLGVNTTPLLYYATFERDVDGGIQITGSHNPPEYNGFKVCLGKTTIHGQDIQKVYHLIRDNDLDQGQGSVTPGEVQKDYIKRLVTKAKLGPRKFKIVMDAGNGTAGLTALPVFEQLGFDVTGLFMDMDGTFPNHHPDPTQPPNLRALIAEVARLDAEVGLAFDGDADRLGVVDRRGRIVWGDQLMILLSRDILKEKPNASFVFDVKCSSALPADIKAHGGNPIMWKTGHSLIKAKMQESGAMLAGEMSGHIFFAHRYYGFDDAVYSALRLVEMLTRSEQTMEEIISGLPELHNTPEIRMDCPEDLKFRLVERAVAHFKKKHDVIDVDGARIVFPDGWGLVRASNTQPVLVLRFEAETEERVAEIQKYVESELDRLRAELAGT